MTDKQVLVVDHSAQRRSQLKRLLAEVKIRALEAASCEEALTIIQRENIPLVLTETELPSKSGLYLLKTIKERALDVEVILITHNASSYNLLQALRNGAYDFIVRPIDSGEILYNAMERAFRQIQLRRENQQLLLELERQNRSLQHAHKMLRALNSSIERLAMTVDIEDLFMELLTCATTELHAARGFLALFDRDGSKLLLRAGKGISNETCRQYAQGIPSGLTISLARHGKPVLVSADFPDTLTTRTAGWELNHLLAGPGLLAAPLQRNGRNLGLVVISGNLRGDEFGEHELNFLIQLAHHAVLALEKVGIIHQLKRGIPLPAR